MLHTIYSEKIAATMPIPERRRGRSSIQRREIALKRLAFFLLITITIATMDRTGTVGVAMAASCSSMSGSSLAFVAPNLRKNVPVLTTGNVLCIPRNDHAPLKSTLETAHDVLEKSKVAGQNQCLNREKSLAAKLEVDPDTTHSHRPLIIGHRGSLYRELENTLQSRVQ